ncbi:hypothetical protein BB559_000663 [Furculomyces boomerangus]|uniref:Chitin-binding type-4 domain-containing protein n=2 Tax=Harpellales TaxID=61421 RepID=A0A2T9Z4J3_9FUNG|nr:hypothetical protein BB559_000663 [Furculomyces boomerangus]PVZ97225.1 hypothetical protein BB558_006827 [Smittium angustum]PVZ97296.1 hypothetical protein BB558_006750 [Smittium angustum]
MLKYPQPRGNKKWWGVCGAGMGCKGPCDSSSMEARVNMRYEGKKMLKVRRGQEIPILWNRLNHPGGFIRLAITKFKNSDSWESFNSNVIKYVCHEQNCGPSTAYSPYGHLCGSGNAQCSTKLTIPTNLENGLYTLQWMWFGGGIVYGRANSSFGEYYGCSDFRIKGKSIPTQEKTKPEFVGGDIMYPKSNICRYWGSNRVGECTFGDKKPNPVLGYEITNTLEPCMFGGPKAGKPFGM